MAYMWTFVSSLRLGWTDEGFSTVSLISSSSCLIVSPDP